MADTNLSTGREGEGSAVLRTLLQFGTVQRVHGEKLDAILQLLQPASAERDGPTLEEMMKALLDRLDTQADLLRLIAKELTRQSKELPGEVASAIAAAGPDGLVLPHGPERIR